MTTENQTHIPEGWKESELGAVIIEKAKSTIKVSEAANFGEYPFFTSGDSILLHDKKIIEGENLFLATGGVANIKYFDGEAAYSTDTFAISTNEEAKAQYLYYYLLSKVGYINKNHFEGSGLKHLQKKDFRKHAFVLPSSPTEQQKIASILLKLDEAITQTEQLIDKYKKIKDGLMHDLLMRGIDEQGNIRSEETHKFKDSPLGRIPEEWEVVKLGTIIYEGNGTIQTGPFGSQLHANEYVEEGVPVIMPQNILQEGIDKGTLSFISKAKASILKRHITYANDIVFARRGDLSKCAVIETDFIGSICGTGCLLIRINKANINPFWLRMLYQQFNCQKEINISSVGSTMQNLNTEILSNLIIPKISRTEQNLIVDKIYGVDTLIENYIHNYNKISKTKSGLMHDLLTGKIRVSNCEEQEEQSSNVNVGTHKTQAHNQHIEDAVLIGAIVNAFYSDKYTLGRKKIQKLLYLVRRHQEASVACFKKKAAGPYADEVRYKGGEPIAKANKYITTKTNNLGTVFSKGENTEKALAYIEKWEMLSDIDWLLTQFKYTKVDQLELIATIDMARCDLEKEGTPVSLSTIKHLIATNEEWKAKLKKDYFDDFSIQRGIDESYKLFGE